jgi:hypothetical protein
MSEYTPRETVLAAHLDGEAVLLEMDRKRYFRLNETGQAIWRALEAGRTADEVVEALVETFDVDPDTARAELGRFIEELSAEGLVRQAPDT